MSGSSYRALAVSSVLLAASAALGQAQQQGDQAELVRPDVEGEVPPVMLDTESDPQLQEHDTAELLVSLRRAQESLQPGNQTAAMQSLISAEEQLDQASTANPDRHPWQQVRHALQEAMKALAADNPRYAQLALEQLVGPLDSAVE